MEFGDFKAYVWLFNPPSRNHLHGSDCTFCKKNKREQNNVHRTMTYKTTVIINARSFRMPIWRKYVRLSTYFCVCTFVFLMAKTSRNIPLRSTFRFMPFLIHCIELERFPGVKRTYRFAHVSTHTQRKTSYGYHRMLDVSRGGIVRSRFQLSFFLAVARKI